MLQVRLVKTNLYFSRNAAEVDSKTQSTSIFRDKTNSRFIERNKEEMIKEVIKDRKWQHYSGLPAYCDVTASPQSQQLGNYY